MMRSDCRFALLTNGSDFSRRVVECLVASHCLPDLIAFPEYPPAVIEHNSQFNIEPTSPKPEIIALLPDTPVLYAPASDPQALIDGLQQTATEFILVACWPYLIDSSIYQCASKAALNLHPSLLPDYRGPDPLRQQLSRRETKFGVTLHLLDDKFDQGDIVAQAGFEVAATELDLARLQQECAVVGVELFIAAIDNFAGQEWKPIPQAAAR